MRIVPFVFRRICPTRLAGLIVTVALLVACRLSASDNELTGVVVKNFKKPDYSEKTGKLSYILYGENAKTVGAIVKMQKVRLEFMESDEKTVKGIIISPEADYDRAAKLVKGDCEVQYQAPTIDARGLGFDADEKRQIVHIRKDVKVTIHSVNPLFQKRETAGKAEKSAN